MRKQHWTSQECPRDRLQGILVRLNEALETIGEVRDSSEEIRILTCLIILEEDVSALIEEGQHYTAKDCQLEGDLLAAFEDRCATILDEVLALISPGHDFRRKPFEKQIRHSKVC